jgi:hypothetical protein
MIYHIRKPPKAARGNQWYKDHSNRDQGTYCGADVTDHDVGHHDKATPWGEWTPCRVCIENRRDRP